MTALEMAGISISLLPDDESSTLSSLLDVPTSAHAWVPSADLLADAAQHTVESDEYIESLISGSKPVAVTGGIFIHEYIYTINTQVYYTHTIVEECFLSGPSCEKYTSLIKAICSHISSIEPQLTEMDNICGDGDCGLVMKVRMYLYYIKRCLHCI